MKNRLSISLLFVLFAFVSTFATENNKKAETGVVATHTATINNMVDRFWATVRHCRLRTKPSHVPFLWVTYRRLSDAFSRAENVKF